MDSSTPPSVEVPTFQLVEKKKNTLRNALPAVALTVSTGTAIAAASYFAARAGVKDGSNVVLAFLQNALVTVQDTTEKVTDSVTPDNK